MGKGPPGGSWHRMDPNLRTLSLSTWMSLPGLDFHTWDETHPNNIINTNSALRAKRRPNFKSNNANLIHLAAKSNNKMNQNIECKQCLDLLKRQQLLPNSIERSSNNVNHNNEYVSNVVCSQCINDRLGLNDISCNNKEINMVNVEIKLNNDNRVSNQIVPTQLPRRILSVKRQSSKEVQTRALVSRVAEYYESYVTEMGLDKYFSNDSLVTSIRPIPYNEIMMNKNVRWIVSGLNSSNKPFTYVCRNVVLANGASDLANRLGLRGEDLPSAWIKHDLPQLESALINLSDKERSSK